MFPMGMLKVSDQNNIPWTLDILSIYRNLNQNLLNTTYKSLNIGCQVLIINW